MERFVGIDLGIATKHKAAVYDGLTPVGKPFSVETSYDGLEYLLKRSTDGAEGLVHFVMEPTSNVDMSLDMISASPNHFSLWTVLGDEPPPTPTPTATPVAVMRLPLVRK